MKQLFYLICIVSTSLLAWFSVSIFFGADSTYKEWLRLLLATATFTYIHLLWANDFNHRFADVNFKFFGFIMISPFVVTIAYVIATGDRSFFFKGDWIWDLL